MDFIAIDFETANYERNSACSIGLVRFVNGEPHDSFYSLIKPPSNYFVPDFIDIHGITFADVRNELSFAELWQEKLLPFIDDLPDCKGKRFPLVAHNAGFDMSVLKNSLQYYELAVPKIHYTCSLMASQRTWPYFSSHKLTSLAEQFGMVYNAHNALDDADICGKIFCLAAKEKKSLTVQSFLKATKLTMKTLSI